MLKILVLGGYGVFGGRLCELLAPDARLQLMVAGRSVSKAQSFCATLGAANACVPLAFDREGDAVGQLQEAAPNLVIDASGPFQAYGDQRYGLIEACLSLGIDYLDFADGAEFVDGVSRFDQAAQARGIFVLSGVSSFPVLTAAVVRQLSAEMTRLKRITGGIAPSPFAGVGLNVIRAIAGYAGQPVALRRAGRDTQGYALTEIHHYRVRPPGHLPLDRVRFSLVDVPDLRVLPQRWPSAETVWMGAGPVPEILHRALNGLAWLVRWRLLPSLRPFSALFHLAINTLRFGEHRGGMFVEVEGENAEGGSVTRSWHLVAEGDDGPYIPCMALQAVVLRLLDGKRPSAGARSAANDLELDDYQPLFSARRIVHGMRGTDDDDGSRPLFARLLGSAWDALPAPIRAAHDGDRSMRLRGRAEVQRGPSRVAAWIANLFGFPKPGRDIEVEVQMQRDAEGERWQRSFAGRRFNSELSAPAGRWHGLLCERFGPWRFAIALVREGERLNYVVRHWALWGLPLPRRWAPGGNSYEQVIDGRFHFHVEIALPLLGTMVRYVGWLEVEPDSSAT